MKRLLFITYYFPPSGGPGVQRSLKFVKYLEAFGWHPTVLTVRPEHAAYPDLDPDLAGEVPASVQVERTTAWDPYALYAQVLGREKQDVVSVGFLGEHHVNLRQRIARWIRANIFLPDARVGWVPFAAARGHRLLEEGDFDAVLTTGPPHSTHLIGLILRFIHQKPWLVDLRDPWTSIDYSAELPATRVARRIDAELERWVLANASLAVARSETMGRHLLTSSHVPTEIIENGFDPEDISGIEASPPPDTFVIRHVGSVNQARNPNVLWRALKKLDARRSMPDLRISFVGNIEPAVLESAAENGLDGLVGTLPYVPHEAAVKLMKESTILLLCVNRVPGDTSIVPGKIYEYVASGRPILGIGPRGGDAARVLGESGAGQMFDYEDVDGVMAYLRSSYDTWSRGRTLQGASWDRALWYSRRRQTERLARLLDSMV